MKRIKNILKKIPYLRCIYTNVRSWREIAEAKKIFINHELYFKALVKKGVGTIVLETCDGLNITIRQNIWDARIIKEIFIDKPYIRHFDFPENPTIVDVGGYIGDFSIYAVKYLKAGKVIVYEPTSENFEILKQNVENNSYKDQIVAVNKAVSNSSGEIILNTQVLGSEEVHVSAYMYPEAEQRLVQSITLADILAEHQLDSVDLLKVDCEGGEYDIFPSVTDETFSKIKNVVFEYHQIDGYEEKLKLVLNRLRSIGYTLRVEAGIVYAYRA